MARDAGCLHVLHVQFERPLPVRVTAFRAVCGVIGIVVTYGVVKNVNYPVTKNRPKTLTIILFISILGSFPTYLLLPQTELHWLNCFTLFYTTYPIFRST